MTEENSLVKYEQPPPMTVREMKANINLIQDVMKEIMKPDEHYGVIPGTIKPTLLKPGAEKLSATFHLVPKYEISETMFPNNHKEVKITCSLYHALTGVFWGQGVGSCSTLENKYRYRSGEPELTDKVVPKKYWDLRKANKMAEAQELLGGKEFTTKKTDAGWMIAKKTGEKVEHDNPADYFNTVLKMAKKRAHVDAILTATAASDIFTQDVEDSTESHPEPKKQDKSESPGEPGIKYITEPQRKKLFAMLKEADENPEDFKIYLKTVYAIGSTKDIPADKFDEICKEIERIKEKKDRDNYDVAEAIADEETLTLPDDLNPLSE